MHRPTFRRFQFSLRALLVFVTLCALPLSWLAVKIREAKREQDVVAELEKLGGSVGYDWQVDASFGQIPNARARGPAWLRKLLGVDLFQSVVCVDLSGGTATDSALNHISDLRHLRALWLFESEVTDDGLKRCRGLDQLQWLSIIPPETRIDPSRVTDTGVRYICEMTKLQDLELRFSGVTDSGLSQLATLPRLRSLSLDGARVTDAGLEHIKSSTQICDLSLSGTEITDAGLKHLSRLTELKTLYLNGTRVTDLGLKHLKCLSKLEFVSLDGTQVSDEGFRDLERALPKCRMFLGLLRPSP